jgi:signal peptidase II
VATTEVRVSSNVRTGAFARAGGVVAVVLIVDQLTKHIVRSSIAVGQVNKLVLGVKLVDVRNTGVAFSLFSGGGGLVLAFTFVALAVLLGYLAIRPERPWLWLSTGLLTGGAIGNLVDRLVHGAVTDFIKLPLWPAFNVADMAITFGVFALLYALEGKRRGSG